MLHHRQERVLETLLASASQETEGFIQDLPASTCSRMGDLLTDTQLPAERTAIVSAAQRHALQPGASLSLQLIFEFASSRSWIRDADYMSDDLSEDVLKLLALKPGVCLAHMTVVAKKFDQQCQEEHHLWRYHPAWS